jgi:hypothetical protein
MSNGTAGMISARQSPTKRTDRPGNRLPTRVVARETSKETSVELRAIRRKTRFPAPVPARLRGSCRFPRKRDPGERDAGGFPARRRFRVPGQDPGIPGGLSRRDEGPSQIPGGSFRPGAEIPVRFPRREGETPETPPAGADFVVPAGRVKSGGDIPRVA